MSKYQEILDYVKWYQEEHKDKNSNTLNPIFEIMLFEYPNKEMIYHKPEGDVLSGWPDTGCVDHVGFYYELDTAIQTMNENWGDIQETCYHAGFILCRFPGLYQAAIHRIYFLWNEEKKGFFEAEEPEIFKHVAY
jgi:hypothetical protein